MILLRTTTPVLFSLLLVSLRLSTQPCTACTPSGPIFICATDGCGNEIQNNGLITSAAVNFTLGTNGFVAFGSFNWVLTGGLTGSCGSVPCPTSFAGLALGSYTFAVTGTDVFGNTVGPVIFSWTIVSRQAALQQLIADVNALNPPQNNALINHLNQAIGFYSNINTVTQGDQKLNQFINQIGNLTQPPANKPLTAAQGQALISAAQKILCP